MGTATEVWATRSTSWQLLMTLGATPSSPTQTSKVLPLQLIPHLLTSLCLDVARWDLWEAKNDPPLREMCSFSPKQALVTIPGTYTITSSAAVWVVDVGEEFGEAVGGILAAGGVFIVGLIVIIVGLILSCVGCCCMCMGEKS